MIEQDIRKGLGASASRTALAPASQVKPASGLEQSRSSTGAKATVFHQASFEAFNLSGSTKLYEPLSATTLEAAEAEVTARWSWNRGDRFALREIGEATDRLHVYAVRQKSQGVKVWDGYVPSTMHQRWIDRICTVDLNVVAGIPIGLIGGERTLHACAQRRRPFGAQFKREK